MEGSEYIRRGAWRRRCGCSRASRLRLNSHISGCPRIYPLRLEEADGNSLFHLDRCATPHWCAIGYDYYDRHARMAIPAGEHPIPLPKVKTTEQWDTTRYEPVLNQTFTDQEVRLDGREFISCRFKNVTFVYDGTARAALMNVFIDRTIPPRLQTTNPAIENWSDLMRGLGMTQATLNQQLLPALPTAK